MLRKDLIELLRNGSMDLVGIARALVISQKDVEDDLRHLIKSLYLISNRTSDSR